MSLGLGTLLGSVGLAQVGADALDKACEMLFGTRAKDFLNDLHDKVRAYAGQVPPNHDLEHAIRYSELTASIALLEHFRRQVEAEQFDERAARVPPFVPAARAWLFGQIGLCPSLKLAPNEAIVAELNTALDRALPASDRGDLEAVLAGTARQVWGQLVAGAGEPVPDGFEALFFGRGADEPANAPGWAVLFVAFMREQLKDRPRAQVAFVSNRLAAVADILRRAESTLSEIRADTARLLAFAEEERRRLGIAEGFVHEMAGRIAASGSLDLDGKMQAVRAAIDLYVAEVARGSERTNLGDLVDQALAKARKLADQGKSRLATLSLRRAADGLRQEEEERRAHYVESMEILHYRERDIALAAYDGDGATEAVIALAEALHGTAAEGRSRLDAEADALYEYGRDRGSNIHLLALIALRRHILAQASEMNEIARATHDLGTALRTLGERESGTARLEEAAAAYRAALEERMRDRVPLDWAMSTGSLGVASLRLAERRADATLAAAARAQIASAFALFRDAGHEPNRDYCAAMLREADALVRRLGG